MLEINSSPILYQYNDRELKSKQYSKLFKFQTFKHKR